MTKKWVLTDFVSKTQSQYLKAALNSYFNVQRPLAEQVPKGYHFLYFNPKTEEDHLSKDGYDSHQEPPSAFKRRLWTSGELNFIKPLNFNHQGFCIETVDSVRKVGTGSLVTINREILSHDVVSIEEKRSLFYTNDIYKPIRPKIEEGKVPEFSHLLKPSELLLFRFSGLTYNSHKIHYDKNYASKEGYPDILVQGPLTIVLLLEWFQTLFDVTVKHFKYKNNAPIFVNSEIRLCLRQIDVKKFELWIENAEDHSIHMSGDLIIA